MRRFALLAALSLASPAGAQPYATLGEALWALHCRQTGVCDPVRQCPALDVRSFNPALAGWPRYGHPSRPVHISDGTHSAGLEEAKRIVARADNPLKLADPPASWTEITGQDELDLNLVRCGGQSARARLIALFGEPAPPPPAGCPTGWHCTATLPEPLRAGCASGLVLCEVVASPPSDAACYREHPFPVRGQSVAFLAPRCNWRTSQPSPPPPACRDFRTPTQGGGPVVVGADEAAAILPLAVPASLSVRVCDLDRAALGGRQVTLVSFAGGAGPLSRSDVAGRSRLATVTVTSDAQGEFGADLPAGNWWLDAGPAPAVFDVFVVEPLPPPPPPGDECGAALDKLRDALEAAEVCRG